MLGKTNARDGAINISIDGQKVDSELKLKTEKRLNPIPLATKCRSSIVSNQYAPFKYRGSLYTAYSSSKTEKRDGDTSIWDDTSTFRFCSYNDIGELTTNSYVLPNPLCVNDMDITFTQYSGDLSRWFTTDGGNTWTAVDNLSVSTLKPMGIGNQNTRCSGYMVLDGNAYVLTQETYCNNSNSTNYYYNLYKLNSLTGSTLTLIKKNIYNISLSVGSTNNCPIGCYIFPNISTKYWEYHDGSIYSIRGTNSNFMKFTKYSFDFTNNTITETLLYSSDAVDNIYDMDLENGKIYFLKIDSYVKSNYTYYLASYDYINDVEERLSQMFLYSNYSIINCGYIIDGYIETSTSATSNGYVSGTIKYEPQTIIILEED